MLHSVIAKILTALKISNTHSDISKYNIPSLFPHLAHVKRAGND